MDRKIPRNAVLPQDEHPSGQRSMWEAPGEERRPRARRPSDGPSPSSEAPVTFLLSSVFPSVHGDTASPDGAHGGFRDGGRHAAQCGVSALSRLDVKTYRRASRLTKTSTRPLGPCPCEHLLGFSGLTPPQHRGLALTLTSCRRVDHYLSTGGHEKRGPAA